MNRTALLAMGTNLRHRYAVHKGSQMPSPTCIPVAIVSAFLMMGQPVQAFAQSSATIRNDEKQTSVAQRRAQVSPATDANKKKADLEKEVARKKAELEKLKREAEETNDRSGFGKFAGGLVGDDAGRGTTAGTAKNSASTTATRSKNPVKDSVNASADPCAIAVNPCKPKK